MTTTDVVGDLDLDTFLRELADAPDVPCTFLAEDGGPCPRPARWATRCEGCGWDIRACDECRSTTDHVVSRGRRVRCIGRHGEPFCGTTFPAPIPWRPL